MSEQREGSDSNVVAFPSKFDPGTIKSLHDAPGLVVVAALPRPPYYSIIPVVKLALVKRDGADHVEALVSLEGQYEFSLLSQAQVDAYFITFADLALLAHPAFNVRGVGDAVFDGVSALLGHAMDIGRQLEAYLATQQASLVSPAQGEEN